VSEKIGIAKLMCSARMLSTPSYNLNVALSVISW
jgi:hypothetical protein